MKLTKHKVRLIEGQDDFNLPDVINGEILYYPHEVESFTYLGSTEEGHEVFRKDDGHIAVIYSIDLDWYEE